MTDTISAAPLKHMGHKEFIILMALMMSIVAISIDALLPALGLIGSDFKLQNPNHTQLVIGCIFMGMTIGQLLWGPLSDAWGRKPILYLSVGMYLAGSVACYCSDGFAQLLAGRVLQGFGVAGPYVTTVSIVRDKFAGRDMARIMSMVMMIFILVPALAPMLGQAIISFTSWRNLFLLYVLYASAITAWIYLRMGETHPVERRTSFTFGHVAHGLREVLSNRITACYMLCMGICFASFIGYLTSSQQIFQVQFATGEMFVVYFGLLALVFGAASLTNSIIVKRLGIYFLCLRGFIIMAGASGLFLLAHAMVEIQLWMFMLYAIVLFFSFGLVFGNLNAMAMEPMGHIAGIAAAIIGATSSLISMIFGNIIGQMYDGTLLPVTGSFFICTTVAALLVLYAEKGRTYHE